MDKSRVGKPVRMQNAIRYFAIMFRGRTMNMAFPLAACRRSVFCAVFAFVFISQVYAQDVLISTEDELIAFAEAVNAGDDFSGKTVLLENDITLTQDWTPIGNSEDYWFSGIFDGQGYKISGLSVIDNMYSGLFGNVYEATIKNINIIDADVKINAIEGCSSSCSYYAGVLVGYSEGDVTIQNSFVGGNISIVAEFDYMSKYNSASVGGLIGAANYNHSIENSYSGVNISGNGTYVGGLIGYIGNSNDNNITIKNSYTDGKIYSGYSGSYVGGLIGNYFRGSALTVENSYVNGEISCNGCTTLLEDKLSGLGALIGILYGARNKVTTFEATSVYYNTHLEFLEGATLAVGNVAYLNGSAYRGGTEFYDDGEHGIFGLEGDELKEQVTFEGWDFDGIWRIHSSINNGYPYLSALENNFVEPEPSSISGEPEPSSSSSEDGDSSSSGGDDPSSSSGEEDNTPIRVRVTFANIIVKAVNNSIQLENLSANAKIEVFNLSGKRVNILNSGNSQILKIPVQTKGMYIVKINNAILRVPVL